MHPRETELKQFWVFLERNGSHLIQIDASPETAVERAKEFLAVNDMIAAHEPIVVGDLVFVGIDPTSTDMSAFYTWREVAPGTIPSKEVWRSFLWLSNEQADPFGVNRLLDTIPMAEPPHTAFTVLSSYLGRP